MASNSVLLGQAMADHMSKLRKDPARYSALLAIYGGDTTSPTQALSKNSVALANIKAIEDVAIRRNLFESRVNSFIRATRSSKFAEYLKSEAISNASVDSRKSALAMQMRGRMASVSSRTRRSGIVDAHSKAMEDIANRKQAFLERHREFMNSLAGSGFSRYAEAERISNASVDAKTAEREEIDAEAKVLSAKRRASAAAYNRAARAKKYHDVEAQGKRNLARRDMVFRQFPWLKPMSKAYPIIGKNLPIIANALKKGAKMPVIGQFIRHPAAMAALFAVAAGRKFLNAAGSYSNMLPVTHMTGVSQGQLRTAGHMLSEWGGSGEDLAKSISSFGGKQGAMFAGLGDTKHLERLGALGIDIRGSGKGGLLNHQERIQRISEAIRSAHASGDTDRIIALSQAGDFSPAMVEAAIHGKDFSDVDPLAKAMEGSTGLGGRWNRWKDSWLIEARKGLFGKGKTLYGDAADLLGMAFPFLKVGTFAHRLLTGDYSMSDAISSANDYAQNPSSTGSGGGTVIIYQNGDLSLPNVQDAQGFVSGIIGVAGHQIKSIGKPIIDMFSNGSVR